MKIRRLEEKDLETRVEWMNSPAIYQSMHYDVPVTLGKTVDWYNDIKRNTSRCDVVFEEDGNIVAFGGLTGIDKKVFKAELYVFVNPHYLRGGIGSKATKLLCDYGFENLGLCKIYLETNEDNIAARRVYERCGFKLEGVHREEYKTTDGRLLSRMYYGLLKRELYG